MKARAAANGLYGSASDADDSLAAITQDRVPPLSQWAYVRFYGSETERAATLDEFLHAYNHHRYHTAIDGPPISRVNNVSGDHS
jgi:transposase InsO family protein